MARLGFSARIKINGLPLDIIGDLMIECSYSEVEVKNRESRRVKYLRALETFSFDLTIENNKENPALQAIKAAYKTETPVKVEIIEDENDLDPEIIDMIPMSLSKQYPLEEKMVIDVAMKESAYPKQAP